MGTDHSAHRIAEWDEESERLRGLLRETRALLRETRALLRDTHDACVMAQAALQGDDSRGALMWLAEWRRIRKARIDALLGEG